MNAVPFLSSIFDVLVFIYLSLSITGILYSNVVHKVCEGIICKNVRPYGLILLYIVREKEW